MIVLQSTIQPFTNISRQIKGIEIRKQERKILNKIQTATTTYTLLDNDSQSTLIKDDFAQGLKLKGYKKTVSISSVIDEEEDVKVQEVSLRIQDMRENNELHISALTLPKNMFNMPAQSILEKERINK